MSETGVAKLFKHGRSQAVRLPRAFRLPGERVRVRRVANGILLEPIVTDLESWFAEMDRFADIPFMEEGRHQPAMRCGSTLVTANVAEFRRVPGLVWEDWTVPV